MGITESNYFHQSMRMRSFEKVLHSAFLFQSLICIDSGKSQYIPIHTKSQENPNFKILSSILNPNLP